MTNSATDTSTDSAPLEYPFLEISVDSTLATPITPSKLYSSISSSQKVLYPRSSIISNSSSRTTNSLVGDINGEFVPSVKAWICALLFTAVSALIAPLFLFRAYSMPFSPLFIPVLVYPLCKKFTTSHDDDDDGDDDDGGGNQKQNGRVNARKKIVEAATFLHKSRLAEDSNDATTMAAAVSAATATATATATESSFSSSEHCSVTARDNKAAIGIAPLWIRIRQWLCGLNIGLFSKEEIVWITSMVAAGGSFAPAYQWIATIDTDFGQPLESWQKFIVVLSSQLFGWSLGHMLQHVFVGRGHGMVWPDNLPLSYLIQTLFPYSHSRISGQKFESRHLSQIVESDKIHDSDRVASDIDLIHVSDSNATISDGVFLKALDKSRVQQGQKSKIQIKETSYNVARDNDEDRQYLEESMVTTSIARKRRLFLLTSATFVYQFVLSYIAPVFKSLCLLCIWAPRSKLMGLLGSGWNGTGILSLTFDWTAMGTLQPLVTPLWAQMHYYVGAALMLYILTPICWHMNLWNAQDLPIVSTSVYDIGGNMYNISLVHHNFDSAVDFDIFEPRQLKQHSLLSAIPLTFNPYSPVRLAVNSALGYICSVAAITAAAMHLAIWHPQWLRQAASDMAHSLLRLWDPRLLFRTRPNSLPIDTTSEQATRAEVGQSSSAQNDSHLRTWDILYIVGRVGRILVFTGSLGVALFSTQMGISRLPGWQILIAVVWATLMCLPIGFVESVTGFTLPTDLLPHIFAGWMQGPGKPIETSYFHLWSTVPIQVALGWSGVRSYQLVYHCFSLGAGGNDGESKTESRMERSSKTSGSKARRSELPWIKRGLIIGVVLGACINHLSYLLFIKTQGEARTLPIGFPAYFENQGGSEIFAEQMADAMAPISLGTANDTDVPTAKLLGWHEEGEFGRLPAALSSELVVWGIVGPQSLFSASSPYRLIFVYGSLIGILLPPLFYLLHRVLLYLSARMRGDGMSSLRHPRMIQLLRKGANAAKEIQVPLILTGMVAVPTIPANFIITGLVVAVVGQSRCRYKKKTLADRSLYSAAMDTGTRLSVALMFVIGQILSRYNMPLSFVSWWGNQAGNVEHCFNWQA